MSTPRAVVVEALEATMPTDVRVVPYARNIAPPSQSTVLVRVDRVVPNPDNPQAQNLYTFGLVLIPPTTEPETSDVELDALLEDVLHAIGKAENLTWSEAVRGSYQDTDYPAYEVTLSVPFKKEP